MWGERLRFSSEETRLKLPIFQWVSLFIAGFFWPFFLLLPKLRTTKTNFTQHFFASIPNSTETLFFWYFVEVWSCTTRVCVTTVLPCLFPLLFFFKKPPTYLSSSSSSSSSFAFPRLGRSYTGKGRRKKETSQKESPPLPHSRLHETNFCKYTCAYLIQLHVSKFESIFFLLEKVHIFKGNLLHETLPHSGLTAGGISPSPLSAVGSDLFPFSLVIKNRGGDLFLSSVGFSCDGFR